MSERKKMEGSPYAPPRSDAAVAGLDSAKSGRGLAIVGVAFFTGPVWGKLVTVIAIMNAFGRLSSSREASPEALAKDVSSAQMGMLIGLGVGLVGGILMLVALCSLKNREKWFYWSAVAISIIWCLVAFPIGLVVGVPVAAIFVSKRAEFSEATVAQQGDGA